MEENLIRLYNTLLTIPTTGQHTKTMADCLRFIEQMVAQEQNKQTTQNEEQSKKPKQKEKTDKQ